MRVFLCRLLIVEKILLLSEDAASGVTEEYNDNASGERGGGDASERGREGDIHVPEPLHRLLRGPCMQKTPPLVTCIK